MKQSNKEAFIKRVREGKATSIKEYIYAILLKNPNQTKEDLTHLLRLNKSEIKQIDVLTYEGFIHESNGVLIPMDNITTINALHELKKLERFRKDRDRFIKKHESRLSELLITQLRGV